MLWVLRGDRSSGVRAAVVDISMVEFGPAFFLAFSKFLMGGIVGSQQFIVVANASFF